MNTRRIWIAAIACCALGGLALLGSGIYIHAKAQLAQILLHKAWSRTLAGEERAKPWPWADTWPVARLIIAKHGVDMIVLAGDSGRVLAFGPGYHFGSAAPGSIGRTLVSAHRDTHFSFLNAVAPGDEFDLQLPDKSLQRYRIADTQIVDALHASFTQHDAATVLTLITCYPFDAVVPGGPLRYVVTADRIDENSL